MFVETTVKPSIAGFGSLQAVVDRVDAIIHELETLRRMLTAAPSAQPPEQIAQKLFGVLGQGNWTEYDLGLDWQRFDG